MKVLKPLLWILLAVLIIAQFFHPAKNLSASPSLHDITTAYPASAEVQDILKRACYDCHSNNTVYPWYSKIQPVAWWLNNHITEGKHDLNFNEFLQYRIARQYKKLAEAVDLVNKGEMPLSSYTIIHRNAKLNEDQKKLLTDWMEDIRTHIKDNNPPDSLVIQRKKG
jgi:hypothetical protein